MEQSKSPFFRDLPPEIRHKIYEHLLDPTQHIYMSDAHPSAPIAHTPCIIDADAEDIREATYCGLFDVPDGTPPCSVETMTPWGLRQSTDWCHHWQCEEALPASGHSQSLMGPLLACKRMYGECVGMMYSHTTFSFVNVAALYRFLESTRRDSLELIRHVHLIWRGDGILLDGGDHKTAVDRDTAPSAWMDSWLRLWSLLSRSCPRLSQVRIWYYGTLPRFEMPDDEVLRQLELSGICERAAVSVHMVWTRQFDAVVADGREMAEDDGAVIPDYLRDRGFHVFRTPPAEYEPEVWMRGFAQSENRTQSDVSVDQHAGWGLRHRGPG